MAGDEGEDSEKNELPGGTPVSSYKRPLGCKGTEEAPVS